MLPRLLVYIIIPCSAQVAIPIVPTIRVLVTFTKFEELQPAEEFSTPLSSPAHFQDAKSKDLEGSSSWISWIRGSRGGQSSDGDSHRYKDEIDPFNVPSDYKWVDANEKKCHALYQSCEKSMKTAGGQVCQICDDNVSKTVEKDLQYQRHALEPCMEVVGLHEAPFQEADWSGMLHAISFVEESWRIKDSVDGFKSSISHGRSDG